MRIGFFPQNPHIGYGTPKARLQEFDLIDSEFSDQTEGRPIGLEQVGGDGIVHKVEPLA